MKFLKYPSIEQYRNVVRAVSSHTEYLGKNENGDPIYDASVVKPTLRFKGTIKLHGTNAGICSDGKEIIAQKRSSFLTEDKLDSHFGFNQFVQVSVKPTLEYICDHLAKKFEEGETQFTIYGEWAGDGIQKGVAISQLSKAFYIFDVCYYNPETETRRWTELNLHPDVIRELNKDHIYLITQFPVYELEVDFNNPALVQNELVRLTEQVENECPVSKTRGIDNGLGEGIVWTSEYKGNRYQFKVKGEKHSTSKVIKLAEVDPEKFKSIAQFVEYAVTQSRVRQAIFETNATEKRHTPDVLKWIANDIIKEESDVLETSCLEWKDVSKEVSVKTRNIFFAEIDQL